MTSKNAVGKELVINEIYFIQNKRLILDRALAVIYGVQTKRLKAQGRRNINRFTEAFCLN